MIENDKTVSDHLCPDGGTCLPTGRLVDAPDSKLACRQAGLVTTRMCRLSKRLVVLFMFFVYAIKSETSNYIYVGFTTNMARRLREHNVGLNKSTKAHRPYVLIYSERLATREEARKREKYFKSGVGKEYLRSLVK